MLSVGSKLAIFERGTEKLALALESYRWVCFEFIGAAQFSSILYRSNGRISEKGVLVRYSASLREQLIDRHA